MFTFRIVTSGTDVGSVGVSTGAWGAGGVAGITFCGAIVGVTGCGSATGLSEGVYTGAASGLGTVFRLVPANEENSFHALSKNCA